MGALTASSRNPMKQEHPMQHEDRGGRGTESERHDGSQRGQWQNQQSSWGGPSSEGSSYQDESRRYGQEYGSSYGSQSQGSQYGQGSQGSQQYGGSSQRGWSP